MSRLVCDVMKYFAMQKRVFYDFGTEFVAIFGVLIFLELALIYIYYITGTLYNEQKQEIVFISRYSDMYI